jgi:hypothetical protein
MHHAPSLNFNVVIPTPKMMNNGVDPRYEYCGHGSMIGYSPGPM